jgi:DNA-nicking Smr family endonuclease
MKIKVDLHDFFNNDRRLEQALIDAMTQAQAKRIKLVEIIPGKGSGQLKKYVLRRERSIDPYPPD